MEKIGEIKEHFSQGIEALKKAFTIREAQEAAGRLEELEAAYEADERSSVKALVQRSQNCLLYTSPSPREAASGGRGRAGDDLRAGAF